MDLTTLAKNIELQQVNNEYGYGQNIDYTYRKTNTTVSDIKAFCMEGEFDKKDNEYDTLQDNMSFLSVELSTPPKRGDKVTFNSATWYVDSMSGTNPYDLVCVSDMKHSRGRSKRRDR